MDIRTLAAGLAFVGSAASADPLAGYSLIERGEHWDILCETLDDMGGLTTLDCALRSTAPDTGLRELVIFPGRDPVSLAAPADAVLRASGVTYVFAACPANTCVTDLALEALESALEGAMFNGDPVPGGSGVTRAATRARNLID